MSNDGALGKTGSWTTNDLRNAASKWSLSGDKALLGLLENIHENLHKRTEDVICKLDNLNEELGNTSIYLKNVNNRFIGLNSTQFVECTVQDDDTDVVDARQSPSTSKCEDDSVKRDRLVECVVGSLRQLEGLCERLVISPDSDSDSDSQLDDSLQRSILKPKDEYSSDPLPHIIGSEEWKKKWHIGLRECSSESESDNEDIKIDLKKSRKQSYSSYEEVADDRNLQNSRKSNLTLPISKMSGKQQTRTSESSTATNYSTDTDDSEVVNITARPMDSHSTPKKKEEPSVKTEVSKPKVNASDFAAELAKRLGAGNLSNPINTSVSHSKKVSEVTGTKKPSTAKPLSGSLMDSGFKSGGNIFIDEPPPLDESSQDDKDDMFGSNDDNDSISDGLFSSKPTKKGTKGTGLFGNPQPSKYGDLFSDLPNDEDEENVPPKPKQPAKKPQVTKGLFDDDSDEELFTNKVAQKEKVKVIQKTVTKNVQAAKSSAETKGNLFDDDLQSSNETENKNFKKSITTVKSPPKGLFDDDSDDDSGLFGGSLTFSSKDNSKISQVSKNVLPVKESKANSETKRSLFDDASDDDDLFSSLKSESKSVSQKTSEKPPTAPTLVPKQEPVIENNTVTEEDLFSSLRIPEKKSVSQAKENLKSDNIPEKPVIESTENVPKKPVGGVSMFGDNVNILKGPNSIAASILARKKVESSSDDSENFDQDEPLKHEIISPKPPVSVVKDKIVDRSEPAIPTIDDKLKNEIVSQNKNITEEVITKTSKVSDDTVSQNKSVVDIMSNSQKNNDKKQPESIKADITDKKVYKDLFSDENDDLFSVPSKKSEKLLEYTEPLELPPPLETSPEKSNQPRNANSLFDDDDDDEDDYLFSNLKVPKENKKQPSSMFDDEPKEDIYKTSSYHTTRSLFSDEPPDFDYNSNNTVQQISSKDKIEHKVVSPTIPIERNQKEVKPSSININELLTTSNVEKNEDEKSHLPFTENMTKSKKSLFNDSSDEDDDLFSSLLKKKSDIKNNDIVSKIDETKKNIESETKQSIFTPETSDNILKVSSNKPEVSGDKAENSSTKPENSNNKQVVSSNEADIKNNDIVSKIDETEKNIESETKQSIFTPETSDNILKVSSNKPEVSGDKLENSSTQPENSNNKPVVSCNEVSNKLVVDTNKSEVVNNNPGVSSNQSDNNKKPEVSGSKPEISGKKPGNNSKKSQGGNNKPEISSNKPNISSKKPEVSGKKRKVDGNKLDVKNQKLEVSSSKPDDNSKKPEVDNNKPEVSGNKPNIISKKPEVGGNKPEVSSNKPEVNNLKPEDINNDKPESRTNKTEISCNSDVIANTEANSEEIVSKTNVIDNVSAKMENSALDITKIEKNVPSVSNVENNQIIDTKNALEKLLTSSPTTQKSIEINKDIADKDEKPTVRNEQENDSSKVKRSIEKTKEETDGGVIGKESKIIGKLKTNININVKALMPGSAPVLRKKIVTEPEDQSKLSPEKSISFDSEPSSLDSVLSNNWSKDKIKVQVKRRPQSRRARLEAARKSAADMFYSIDSIDGSQFSSLPNSPMQEDHNESFVTVCSEGFSSLENSTSDQFESPIQTIGQVYANSTKQNIPQSNTHLSSKSEDTVAEVDSKPEKFMEKNKEDYLTKNDNVIKQEEKPIKVDKTEDVKSSNELLKEIEKPKDSKVESKSTVKKVSLFDDLDDDIFKAAKPTKKKSLFGDDDDDEIEDLFSNLKIKSTSVASKADEKDLFSNLKIKSTSVASKADENDLFSNVKEKSTSVASKADEKDLFSNVKEKSTSKTNKVGEAAQKSNTSAIKKLEDKKSISKSIFGDSDSDSELFAPKNNNAKPSSSKEKKKQVPKKKSLFGDSDESEDDLFSNIPKKPLVDKMQQKTQKPKPLFDDDDDNGDIFNITTKKTQTKTVETKSATKIKENTKSSTSKVTMSDPLSSFLNDT